MTKKKKILLNVTLVVIVLVASLLILDMTYQAGRDKGRSETVELIDQLASEYRFKRIEDEDGWVLGAGGGGKFYPDYTGSLITDYNWDDCIIHLGYEKR